MDDSFHCLLLFYIHNRQEERSKCNLLGQNYLVHLFAREGKVEQFQVAAAEEEEENVIELQRHA